MRPGSGVTVLVSLEGCSQGISDTEIPLDQVLHYAVVTWQSSGILATPMSRCMTADMRTTWVELMFAQQAASTADVLETPPSRS